MATLLSAPVGTRIRLATVADRTALLACLVRLATQSTWTQGAVLNRPHLEGALDAMLTNPAARFLVADNEDDHLVGLFVFVVYDHLISGERLAGEVCWWVDPEARPARVGLKLLAQAEAQAATLGARLQMLAPTPTVARFLQHRGYRPTDRVYERTM